MVGLDLHPVLDLDDRHGCIALQQFHQDALAARIEMLDDDKPETARFGDMTEELFQCFQAASGSAKSDDEKGTTCSCRPLGFHGLADRNFASTSGILVFPSDLLSCLFHDLVRDFKGAFL